LSSLVRAVPRPTQASGQPRDGAPCPSCGHRRPRIVAPFAASGHASAGSSRHSCPRPESPNASRRQPRLTDRSVGQSRWREPVRPVAATGPWLPSSSRLRVSLYSGRPSPRRRPSRRHPIGISTFAFTCWACGGS